MIAPRRWRPQHDAIVKTNKFFLLKNLATNIIIIVQAHLAQFSFNIIYD